MRRVPLQVSRHMIAHKDASTDLPSKPYGELLSEPSARTIFPNPARTFFPNPLRGPSFRTLCGDRLSEPCADLFPNPERASCPNWWSSRQSTCPMFLVFQASTAAFDESASPVSDNCRSSALEVCWRDLPTPIHALIVCTAGPPIPVSVATRATASIGPKSGQLPGASSQLPRDPQPAMTSATTCMFQIIRRGRSCDTSSSPARAGGQKAQR